MMAKAAGMAAEYTPAKGLWCSTPCPYRPAPCPTIYLSRGRTARVVLRHSLTHGLDIAIHLLAEGID